MAEAIGIVLPVECVGCGQPDRALCRACRAALRDHPGRVRLVAGVRCDAAFEYTGLARTLLLAFKVRGRTDLAGVLGRATVALLAVALAAAPPGTVVLRVPSSVAGRRRRGFDPVVLLLRRGGVRGTGVRRTRALRRVRSRTRDAPDAGRAAGGAEPPDRGGAAGAGGTSSAPAGGGAAGASGTSGAPAGGGAAGAGGGQKSLTAVERVGATVGTLEARGVAGRTVVLVDDVVTTGVTMAEAARAVRAAGGTVVRCVATASVEPPTPLEGPS